MAAANGLVWRFGTFCLLLCVASLQVDAAERRWVTTTGAMEISVVDAGGQPLPGAKVHVSVWTDEPFGANQNYTCDDNGKATIKLPKRLTILRLWASASGHSSLLVIFDIDRQPEEFVLAKEFEFRLPAGTVMGGIVKNEDGKPIEGVRVKVDYASGGIKLDGPVRHSLNGTARTDAAGSWKLDMIPPGDDVEVRLELNHGDYVSDQPWHEIQRRQKVTRQALRAETATVVMQRGFVVTGTVTDPTGAPVENAVVIWGERPYWQRGSQEVRTNSNGAYRFAPLPAGPMRVTVVAEGRMPDSRKIEIGPASDPADFQLKPGKNLKIRFVDHTGALVPNVAVAIAEWRGAEALYNHKHPNVLDVKIPRQAGSDGVFEWTWAPDDAVSFRFGKPGFSESTVSITASENEIVQTLNPILKIAGAVRDAATGRPLEKFLVVPVIHFRPDFPFLERSHAVQGKQGRFSVDLDRTDIEHGVQIEAPGYLIYRTSHRYRIGESNPELDIRVQPSEPFIGRVVGANGMAVANARVYVATGFQHLDLQNLDDRSGDFTSNYQIKTDDSGAFEIAPQIERYAIVVIAPEGFAQANRESSQVPGEICLQPWAGVRGRLLQASQPIPNCKVYLEPIAFVGADEPRIDLRFYTTTEDDGSFVFERVPPIPCRVCGFLHFARDSALTSSQSVPLSPGPGEQANIVLGGDGVNVIGQLVVEDAPPGFDYHYSINYLFARRPGIEPPASLAGKRFDWHAGWSDSWKNSQEGRAYLKTLHHWFVKPSPKGRIAISGVTPGDYELAVNLYGSTEGCLVHPVATRRIEFSVKPGDSEVDLGRLAIPSWPVPKVGDPASAFAFTTAAGTHSSLGAMRGQYVLLDFWATWCGPCVAKLDEIEQLRRMHTGGKPLNIVGVNLDADTQRAREFLKKRDLPWHHALLGDWSNTDVPRRYAVSSIPAYVLIDPDGRIAAQEYSLEAIALVVKSLSDK